MNQGVVKGTGSPLASSDQVFASCSHDLNPTGLAVLVPDGGVLLPGDATNIPLNWKLELAPGHTEFLCS